MQNMSDVQPRDAIELFVTTRPELVDFVCRGAATVLEVHRWGITVRWLGTVGPSDLRRESEIWSKLPPVPGITDADRRSAEAQAGRLLSDIEVEFAKDQGWL